MPNKSTGKNKYQKKAHRRREEHLRGDDIEYYLSLAYSDNPNISVTHDYETDGTKRFALVCEDCNSAVNQKNKISENKLKKNKS